MIVSLIQITATSLSIFSAWISLKFHDNSVKGVNLRQIESILAERETEYNDKKEKERKKQIKGPKTGKNANVDNKFSEEK